MPPSYNGCNSTGIIFTYHRLGQQRPFKGAKLKQTRGRGKPQGQRQNPPKAQEAEETYIYDSPNNFYHNDNYTAPGQN